jgi:hypothetical protein
VRVVRVVAAIVPTIRDEFSPKLVTLSCAQSVTMSALHRHTCALPNEKERNEKLHQVVSIAVDTFAMQ